MDKKRILFLDVDGPLIPSGMYIINMRASWERLCSPICIAIVNRLCEDAGAKIVLNSTHSRDGAPAIADLTKAGIEEHRWHETVPMTNYPNKLSGGSRWEAIQDWQERCGEVNWVAFDDDNFTRDERLVLIDFDVGVTLQHYNQAAKLWGLKPIFIY